MQQSHTSKKTASFFPSLKRRTPAVSNNKNSSKLKATAFRKKTPSTSKIALHTKTAKIHSTSSQKVPLSILGRSSLKHSNASLFNCPSLPILDSLPGFIFQYHLKKDGSDYFSYLSSRCSDVYGFSSEEMISEPNFFSSYIFHEDLPFFYDALMCSAKSLEPLHIRYRIIHPYKGIRWMECYATVHQDSPDVISWSGYIHDDTKSQSYKEQCELADKFFSSSQEGILIADEYAHILRVNPSFEKITGFSAKELLGAKPSLLSSGLQDEHFYKTMWDSLLLSGSWSGEIINKRKDGTLFPAMLSIDVVYYPNTKKPRNYVALLRDIQTVKEHEDQLTRQAYYDALTDLPNRRLFLERLSHSINTADEQQTTLALCFLDLDGFKSLNDMHGHQTGDLMLSHISRQLLACVRPQDVVARLGGDEFVVLFHGPACTQSFQKDLTYLMTRIVDACSTPLETEGHLLSVSASCGVVLYPQVQGTAEELLRYADQSMYKAKQQGRRRFVFFNQEEAKACARSYQALNAIKDALLNNEFDLFYQPKICLKTHTLNGVEALLRWRKNGTIIPANDFLHYTTGDLLDFEIGSFCLHHALSDQHRWRQDTGRVIPLSVNISPNHLLHPSFVRDLSAALDEFDTPPGALTIEILETTKIQDFEKISETLSFFSSRGIMFSLDDFGSGYASFGYLKSIKLSEVKIDKSFFQKNLESSSDFLVVRGITDLCTSLGYSVVAEGIESLKIIPLLEKIGIHNFQGYGICPPIEESKILHWIKAWENS